MNILKFTNYTYTTKFILPLLFTKNIRYREVIDNLFINAYIADMANKDNDDRIHLLFADYPSLTLQQKLPKPISEYQHEDGFVLVYSLPTQWEEDYLKFIVGKYSKFTEDAKHRMLEFWEEDENSLLYGVLYQKGEAINKYMKEKTGGDTRKWTKKKDWWLPPELPSEILGLGN